MCYNVRIEVGKGDERLIYLELAAKRSFSGCNVGLEMCIWTVSRKKVWVTNRIRFWGECSSVSDLVRIKK